MQQRRAKPDSIPDAAGGTRQPVNLWTCTALELDLHLDDLGNTDSYPETWYFGPRGPRHLRDPKWILDFGKAIPEGMDASLRHGIVRRLMRTALIYRSVPVATFDRSRISKAQAYRANSLSLKSMIHNFAEILHYAKASLSLDLPYGLERDGCEDGFPIFSRLSKRLARDLMFESLNFSKTCNRLNQQSLSGALEDWTYIEDVPKRARHSTVNDTDPYDDSALDKLLRTALRLSQASEAVCKAYESYVDEDAKLGVSKHMTRRERRDLLCSELAAECGWYIERSYLEDDELVLKCPRGQARHAAFIMSCLRNVQNANAIIIAFSTGLRPDELDALTRDCLSQRGGNAYFSGRAFKGHDIEGGAQRDWPIPDIAALALRKQIAIATEIDPSETSLWVSHFTFAKRHSRMSQSGRINQSFPNVVGPAGFDLSDLGPIGVYRLRTSVARLVALSVEGGLLAVSTVFGHKDLGQTIGYCNAKGDFGQEFSALLEEVHRARGKLLVEEGQTKEAPAKLKSFVTDVLMKISGETGSPNDGYRTLGAEDMEDAYQIVGRSLRVVRRGVLCSAQGMATGPCSRMPGHRDAAACKSYCSWRYELSAALDDREAVAEHHLETLGSLEATEELLRVSALTGLFDALRSFEGPLDRFRDDSRLRDVLAGIGTSDLEALGTRTVKNLEELRGAL